MKSRLSAPNLLQLSTRVLVLLGVSLAHQLTFEQVSGLSVHDFVHPSHCCVEYPCSGASTTGGIGGKVVMSSGKVATGTSGSLSVLSGKVTASGTSGAVRLQSGASPQTTGAVLLATGASTVSGTTGSMGLASGATATGTSGVVAVRDRDTAKGAWLSRVVLYLQQAPWCVANLGRGG